MTAEDSVNGAESLVRTLVSSGVDTCFANPGTSEMHFVAALDRVAGIRSVLALFEGVATGAADGYARIAGRPAVTLLHCGPGLANGLANLHNAQRARYQSSTLWAIRRLITAGSTPRSLPIPKAGRVRSQFGRGQRAEPKRLALMPQQRCRRRETRAVLPP